MDIDQKKLQYIDLQESYPPVICYSLLLKIAIDGVDLPTKYGGSSNSYVNVFQRV